MSLDTFQYMTTQCQMYLEDKPVTWYKLNAPVEVIYDYYDVMDVVHGVNKIS